MEIVIPSVVIVIPGAANIGLFLGVALALLLIPSPAVLYIVARSVEQGRLAAFVSDLGIHTATLVHVLAAVVGLSALLASSALAFRRSQICRRGLSDLAWSEKNLRSRGGNRDRGKTRALQLSAPFPRWIHRQSSQPEDGAVFFAFLPQFAEVSRGHVATQIAFLGCTFVALGFITDGCYGLFASAIGGWLKRNSAYRWSGFGVAATVGAGDHRK